MIVNDEKTVKTKKINKKEESVEKKAKQIEVEKEDKELKDIPIEEQKKEDDIENWPYPFTKEMLNSWKKKYGKVFKNTDTNGEVFVWRKLNRSEYVEAMSIKREDENEQYYLRQEMIVKDVLLWPEDADKTIKENAMLATSLMDYVIGASGFIISDSEEI